MNRSERRVASRINLRIPLRFRPIANPNLPEQSAETLNLSQNGVFFATDYPLTVGTPAELLLKMVATGFEDFWKGGSEPMTLSEKTLCSVGRKWMYIS